MGACKSVARRYCSLAWRFVSKTDSGESKELENVVTNVNLELENVVTNVNLELENVVTNVNLELENSDKNVNLELENLDKNVNLELEKLDKNVNQKPEPENAVKVKAVDHGKIVIALDIGTKNMGYAFSCQTRKNKIYTAKNSSSPQSNRMPTAVLLNDDLSLNSIGFAAVSNHTKVVLKKLHSNHLYFRQFRLEHSKQEKMDSEGHVSGEKIVCHIMEVLKRNAFETIRTSLYCEGEHIAKHTEWVLTTPNDITKEAENAVLRAAQKAKLGRRNLVRESDAAALYCQRKQFMITRQNDIINMSKGQRFVLADLGAGKTVISVYEVMTDGKPKMRNYISANVGGNSVNEDFEQFMEMICGSSSWNEFRINHVYDYETLMSLFEDEKVKFDNDIECIVLTLSQHLLGIINANENFSLKERIEANRDLLDKAELIEEKLFIYRNQMKTYFTRSLQVILENLERISEDFTKEDLLKLLLIGGFSASMFIRTKLKEECQSFDIAFVQDPEMVVLKGAVLVGLENILPTYLKNKQK